MKPLKFLTIYMLSWAFRILGTIILSTCHIRVFGREIEEKYFEEHPDQSLIYATWHRGVIYSIFLYRNTRFVVMASTSDDGEIAAQGAMRFGWKVVRGSSTRRGSQALRKMISMTQKGYSAALVVDAPRGPAHISKPGVITLAKMSEIPVLTGIWSADRCWRVNSWDRTIIPKPFSQIVLLYSDELIEVPPDSSREECEQYRQQLDDRLNKMMYQTDHFFTTPGITDPRQIEVPNPVPVPF